MDKAKLKVMIKAYKLNLDYDEIVNHITDYDEVFEDDDG